MEEIKNKLPRYIEELVIAKVPHLKEPRVGITKILEIENGKHPETVMLKIEILTGRTHQIRYHLAQAGLPILRDYLYGKKVEGKLVQLTARKVKFKDLRGEMKSFEI